MINDTYILPPQTTHIMFSTLFVSLFVQQKLATLQKNLWIDFQ